MAKVTALETFDVRFPTSRDLDGSDAMNPDPDYSAAYVVAAHRRPDADRARLRLHDRPGQRGRSARDRRAGAGGGRPRRRRIVADLGGFSASLVNDSQIRWLGPEKGVMHMAIGAVVNAAWDLAGQRAGQPVWELLAVDDARSSSSTWSTSATSPTRSPRAGAGDPARSGQPGKAERIARLKTPRRLSRVHDVTPGWLGYSDEKLVRLAREAVDEGYTQIKLKVGGDLDDDVRALRAGPRGGRPRRPHRHRRQPALGRRRGDRLDERARRVRPVRGSRSRPARTTSSATPRSGARSRPDPRWPPASTRRTGSSSSSCCRPRPSTSCRSTPCRVAGVNENLADPAAGREVRHPGVPARRRRRAVRTGAAPVDLRLRRGDRPRLDEPASSSTSTTCTSTSSTRPGPSAVCTSAPEKPGFSAAIKEATFAEYRFPDGSYWQSEAARS